MTKSLAITPRGIIVDNGKLIPLQYSIDMGPFDTKPCITAMCKSPKDHFPEDLFPNSIAPLPGSFHFRGERISISPEHPLYRFFRWSALQIKYHMAMIIWYWLGVRIEQEPSNADFYEERRQAVWPVIKNVFRTPNCGQPTIEDLTMTRRWNNIHSSSGGSFCGFLDQLDIQEHRQRLKRDGALVVKRLMDQFPIQPDAPFVVIEDSEHPAFSSWQYGELRLSVSAADAVLRHYDAIAFEDGDFCVTNLAIRYRENGSTKVQRLHFYLGNQNGCLTEYLRAYGHWLIDENNRDPDNVITGIELISLAGLLSEYMAPAIIRVEYAPWLQELLALTGASDCGDLSDDISDEEIRDCVLSLPHDDESALVADALIEILSGRDSQKALELYKEWKASDDSLSPAGSAEI